MKKFVRFAGVAILALTIGLASCDDDDPVAPPPPPPAPPAPIVGTVSGTVSVEGSGLEGVTVNLLGAASQSKSTGSSGGYSFADVPAGTHSVQISGAPAEVAFPSMAMVVTIATSGQTATADFSGDYIRTWEISGTVVTAGGEGVVATVTATGKGMLMDEQPVVRISNTDGDFVVPGLRAGDYTVTISQFGDHEFAVSSRTVTVVAGESTSVTFVAGPEPEGTTGSITGQVVTAAGDGIVATVTAVGTGEDGVTQTGVSDTEGDYELPGVEAGDYRVTISEFSDDHEFAVSSRTVTVVAGESASVTFVSGPEPEGTTGSITGQVVTAAGDGIVATVTAVGTGEDGVTQTGVSDTEGDYELPGVEAGDYRVTISEFSDDHEFAVSSRTVTVVAGESASVTFVAEEEAGPTTGTEVLVYISGVRDDDLDANKTSGLVTATIFFERERGDPRPEKIALYVDGTEVATRGFGAARAAEEPALAAQQAGVEFSLSFDSEDYDPETGAVTYPNGAHVILMGVTFVGSEAENESQPWDVDLENDDGYVVKADLGDNRARGDDGRQWYGGPDNGTIDITALPVSYSGGSVTSVSASFCGEDATDSDGAGGYTFVFKCENHESNTDGTDDKVVGDMLTMSSAGEDGVILNAEDLPFPAFVDFVGPSAPTFFPNPNGREGGWVDGKVDYLGAQTTSNENGWLTYSNDDDEAGVGGYDPVLRYAAVPSSGGGTGLDEAIAAPILTLANLPGESQKNAYCAVASAVDLLGNQSALPNAEDHATAAGTCIAATRYRALLDAASADAPAGVAAEENLANAGLRVGVDLTPPTVEFLAASLEDKATSIPDGALWGLHVTDRDGEMHSDAVDVGISVREAKTTTKFTEGTAATDDKFVVNSSVSLRHSVTFSRNREGYYTFSATAMDAAGNESAPRSRVALHDETNPLDPGLFLVPGDDHASYSKTLILTDNLSVKSYSAALILPGVGELTLKTAMVDGYNAASPLTTSKTVQEAVNLPIVAVQDGAAPSPGAMPVKSFKVYSYDQTGRSGSSSDDLSVDATDIDPVMFVATGVGVRVEVTAGDDGVALKATADVADEVGNLEATFSSVAFYATVAIGEFVHLRHIATVSESDATTTLTDAPSRNWIYEAKVSVADFLAAVDDAAGYEDMTGYVGPVFALGMADDGLAVYASATGVMVKP